MREGIITVSLYPSFELGIWNAWILTAIYYVAALVPLLIGRKKANQRGEGEPALSETSKATRNAILITHAAVRPFIIIYSVFLPLELGTTLFHAGLLAHILATVIVFSAGVSFATARLDEPITRGIYGMSRNPLYFGEFIMYLAIALACVSWIVLLCAVIWIVSWHFAVPEEEQMLLRKYGNAYEEYMNVTPRWIGIPKSRKRR